VPLTVIASPWLEADAEGAPRCGGYPTNSGPG